MHRQDITKLLLVIPDWPTQIRFLFLIGMLICEPFIIPLSISQLRKHEGDSPTMAGTRNNEIHGIRRYVALNYQAVYLIMNSWSKGFQKQCSPHIN